MPRTARPQLTLRQSVAVTIAAGLCSRPPDHSPEWVAEAAYNIADADPTSTAKE